MKTILVRYFGKVLTVIKQDGIFGGIRKIFQAAFAILKPVGIGDVLFVSSGAVGNTFRFRVKNVSEELEFNGFRTSVAIQENPCLEKYVDKFSIFVFNLVTYTPQIEKFVGKIKAAGKEIIFETDDLLFDADLVREQDFFKNSNGMQKKFYEKGIGSEFLNDPYVKVATTTTTFLADKLAACGKKVFLVPNKLSENDLKIADNIVSKNSSKIQNSKFKIRNSIRIGYFSGNLSHNQDFASITETLVSIMEKHSEVELILAGPLSIKSTLNKFADRIKQLPYVDRKKHFANLASVDINLAPLEIDNPFCIAKSELKFFEAGIVQVPTVATANQTFCQAIEDGVDGFVAKDTQEWLEKLERLIADENLRKAMGAKAREKALANYTTSNAKNEEYYDYIKTKLKK